MLHVVRPSQEISIHDYDSLPGPNHIRVLEILPGKVSEAVRCQLHIYARKDSLGKYDALSYAWGNANETTSIRLNKKPVSVANSLFHALIAMRKETESRYVWADAICINQRDPVEKGLQVSKMGSVYKNARQVVVYLGQDIDSVAEDTFKLVRETIEYFDKQHAIYGHPQHIPTPHAAHGTSMDPNRWKNIDVLFKLPWFSRLWVVQEVGLSKKCIAIWGHESIYMAELFELITWFCHRRDVCSTFRVHLPDKMEGIFAIGNCSYGSRNTWKEERRFVRWEAEQKYSRRFSEVLDVGRGLKATLDIDRVYAFLGNPLAVSISPDYSKSAEEVYLDTAISLVSHPWEASYVLSFVDHDDESCIEGKGLPSWVPRWDKGWRMYTFGHSNYWYRAGEGHNFDADVEPDNSLWLRSVYFDEVAWTSEPINMYNLSLDPKDWDENNRMSGIPFIDTLYEQVLQAWDAHVAQPEKLSREVLHFAFSVTMIRHYPNADFRGTDFPRHRRIFASYLDLVRERAKSHEDYQSEVRPSDEPYHFYNHAYYAHNRCFAILKSGYFALLPKYCGPQDKCFICPGMKTPIIVRPKANRRYGFVGDAYVYDLMEGAVMDQVRDGMRCVQEILIE